jgi:hypothetical protein
MNDHFLDGKPLGKEWGIEWLAQSMETACTV